MWDLQSFGIAYNAAEGTLALPLWVVGIAVGLAAIFLVLALIRTGLTGTLVFLALVGFGAWVIWSWTQYDRDTERRTLEARAMALETQALAPNSALACLDGSGGDTVEVACERHVFANPESTAAATSYTAARVGLLADGTSFATRRDPGFAGSLDRLRNALEKDRFGVVAHVLAVRKNCTAEKCDALSLFRDAARIRANLRENTFDAHLARAAPTWSARPIAEGGIEPAPARGTALPPGYNLPSAESIPPVSIMTSEPAGTNAPAAAQGPPTPPRRPSQQQQQQQPQQQQQQQQQRSAPRRQTGTASPPRQLPPPTQIQ